MTDISPGVRSPWRRFLAAYQAFLGILVSVLIALLVIPVTFQIFSRFTHFIPHYIWTEEMARFMFIWAIMVGAMIGVRDGSHFDVDLLPTLPPRANAALKLVTDVAMLIFALVFAFEGIEFTEFAWNRTSELADLPLWMIHIAWPVAGFTFILFLAEQMYDHLRAALGRDA
jgi:TRAP-type C4-dicarboxylate transport system permease small subunit